MWNFRYYVLLVLLLGFGSFACAEMRVGTDEALKAAVNKPQPDYPAIARQMRVMGKVEVDVTIDPSGNVAEVKILSGNAMLTQSVVATVKRWKFTPFTQDGQPARAVAELTFDFKM